MVRDFYSVAKLRLSRDILSIIPRISKLISMSVWVSRLISLILGFLSLISGVSHCGLSHGIKLYRIYYSRLLTSCPACWENSKKVFRNSLKCAILNYYYRKVSITCINQKNKNINIRNKLLKFQAYHDKQSFQILFVITSPFIANISRKFNSGRKFPIKSWKNLTKGWDRKIL